MFGQFNDGSQRGSRFPGDFDRLTEVIAMIVRDKNDIRTGDAFPVGSEGVSFKKGSMRTLTPPAKICILEWPCHKMENDMETSEKSYHAERSAA